MTESTDTNLGVQSLLGSAGVAVQQLVGLAVMMGLAYLAGAEGVGAFYLLLAIINVADSPVQGWNSAAHKFYAATDANHEEIVGSQLLVAGAVTAIVALGAFLGRGHLAAATGEPWAWTFLTAMFAAAMLYRSAVVSLISAGQVARKEWVSAIRSVVKSGIQLGMLAAGVYVAGMVAGFAIASFILGIVVLVGFASRPVRPSRATFTQLAGFAKFSMVSALVKRTFTRFDTLLLAVLLTPAVVGYYEVAFRLTMPAFVVSSVIATGLLSRVSNSLSKTRDPAPDVTNALSYASLLAIPLVFGSLVVARPLISLLFSPDLAPAAPFLVALAGWRFLSTQTGCLSSTLAGADRPELIAAGSAVALTVNLVLGVALIEQIGGIGVAVATVIAEAIRYSLFAIATKRLLPSVTLVPRPLLAQLLAGIGMFGFLVQLRAFLSLSGRFDMLGLVAAGVVAYGLLVVGLSADVRATAHAVYHDMRDSDAAA